MKGQIAIGAAGSELAARWDDFVEASGQGYLCHRFSWKSVFESTYGLRGEYLYAERDGVLLGVLPLIEVAGLFSGRRLVSLPFLDQGGPLAMDEEVASKLFNAAVGLAKSRGVNGVDLRGGRFPSRQEASTVSNRFRFLLSLPGDSEELWSKIGGKVRNQIRKSEKSGLQTRPEDEDGLQPFYEIFAENMRDLGSPVHSRKLFVSILEEFADDAHVYVTRDSQGRAVAGGVAIRAGTTVTVPWASSLRTARSSCPNHSLYWRILQDAVAASSTIFDFGRSAEGTGTYRFKKQWNADPMALSWSSFDDNGHLQETRTLDPRRNQRLTQTWSRLPLPVANVLGPRIRKRLSN